MSRAACQRRGAARRIPFVSLVTPYAVPISARIYVYVYVRLLRAGSQIFGRASSWLLAFYLLPSLFTCLYFSGFSTHLAYNSRYMGPPYLSLVLA
ncbi:hypothetical protein C8R44DRAFT_795629 [Mycena epipterygia]|nr:hypothetical protein C8R44DRAFT_795629 [Mycena epipterygia]